MPRRTLIAAVLLLVLLILAGILDASIPHPDLEQQDVYYSFVEGQRLANGQNPYARVLAGDMRTNAKYATYFPVFYELSFASQKLGLESFENWFAFWSVVFVAFEFAIAIVLFWAFAQRGIPWIGLFAAAFWLFDRWTLQIVEIGHLDFMPIFFLLLSLVLFPRHKWLSLFLFGLSLGLKQIAIFLTPLYLIWVWQSSTEHRVRNLLLGALAIASVPFVASIPFLIWDARAFILSVLFSVTRDASQATSLAPALGAFAGGNPLLSRIAMLALMLLLFVFAWRMPRARYVFAFLVMLVFVCFNPVLYVQYYVWVDPLAPLVLCDVKDGWASLSPLSAPNEPAGPA